MKLNIKLLLSNIFITLLSITFLLSFVVNILLLVSYINSKTNDTEIDYSTIDKLESEKWVLEKQIQYKNNICSIKDKLPEDDSSLIYIETKNFDKRIPINSNLNLYYPLTQIFEIASVISSTPISINDDIQKIKVYRIELTSNPNIYLEYVGYTDKPYIYLIKDTNSSEFLLYPFIKNPLVEINTQYYIAYNSESKTNDK